MMTRYYVLNKHSLISSLNVYRGCIENNKQTTCLYIYTKVINVSIVLRESHLAGKLSRLYYSGFL